MEGEVKVTFEHIKTGKKIVFTFTEDELEEKTNINIDFGEEGANGHDGYSHSGYAHTFAKSLGLFK